MLRAANLSLPEWSRGALDALISAISLIVFAFFDLLDFILCFFYRFVDGVLEENPVPCYCYNDRGKQGIGGMEEEEEEEEVSETLYGRRNLFRQMGIFSLKERSNRGGGGGGGGGMLKSRRWSDCGCDCCVSWQGRKGEEKLHLVVREPFLASGKSQTNSPENVVFIHGFLSSSSFWTQTVFPYLSEAATLHFRMFALDLLGFGRSPKPSNCLYRTKEHREMIETSVIKQFQLKSFHLVAHSMGCIIALALASKYPESVKSITLVAPPYFPSNEMKQSYTPLNKLAERRVWPPLLLASSIMSWYEHLGRTVCFLFCRNHLIWEWIVRSLTRRSDLNFLVRDMTQHTHRSAWHTMHNVICGGAKLQDKYLEVVRRAGISLRIIHGDKDQVVPVECSYNMKSKVPLAELQILNDADHNTVIIVLDLTRCSSLHFLPSSLGHLRSLQNLDLSGSSIHKLPESLSCLSNLQSLGLRYCYFLRELPENIENMASLTNLDITSCVQLTFMPSGIGKLNHLRMVPIFVLGGKSNCNLGELSSLKLEGELHIKNLENVKNVKEAKEANLIQKQGLKTLRLSWDLDAYKKPGETNSENIYENEKTVQEFVEALAVQDWVVDTELVEDVLESIQPHKTLSILKIEGYLGRVFPRWLMELGVPDLVELTLEGCMRCEILPQFRQLHSLKVLELNTLLHVQCLPALGQLPSLTVLKLCLLPAIKCLGSEFYGGDGAFPVLEELELVCMPELVEWSRTAEVEFLPRLSNLTLGYCPKLKALPSDFQSVKKLSLCADDELLVSSLQSGAFPNLEHLDIGNCENNKLSSLHPVLAQRVKTIKSSSMRTKSISQIRDSGTDTNSQLGFCFFEELINCVEEIEM